MWLTTRHSALWPHVPGHGSLHFWLMHASWGAHSEFDTHSGRQFGGAPVKPAMQEHEGWSPATLHSALGPQGDGRQGSEGVGSASKTVGEKKSVFVQRLL